MTSDLVTRASSATLAMCAILCLNTDQCGQAAYSMLSGQCAMYQAHPTGKLTYMVANAFSDQRVLHKTPSSPEWTLAFRAQKESDLNLWATWMDTSRHDDDPSTTSPMPSACLTLSFDQSCDKIFRSGLLDQWNRVDKVQIAFFSQGARKAYVVFDAEGSKNKNGFMEGARIVESSIGDINGPFTGKSLISVVGQDDADRRFMVADGVQGPECPNDRGWFVVLGGQEGSKCLYDWARLYPQFLYTSSNEATNWEVAGTEALHKNFAISHYL